MLGTVCVIRTNLPATSSRSIPAFRRLKPAVPGVFRGASRHLTLRSEFALNCRCPEPRRGTALVHSTCKELHIFTFKVTKEMYTAEMPHSLHNTCNSNIDVHVGNVSGTSVTWFCLG